MNILFLQEAALNADDVALGSGIIAALMAVFAVVLIIGVALYINLSQSSPGFGCEELAKELAGSFDNLADMGCYKVQTTTGLKTFSGATIVSIESPIFVNLSEYLGYSGVDEYNYKITFKGNNREKVTYLVSQKNISLEDLKYKQGRFYQFDFSDICGPTTSGGPHGGGLYLVDYNFTKLTPLVC